MTKKFYTSPCPICGKMISNCGFAYTKHEEMHKKQKKVKLHPAVIAINKWFESKEGQVCTIGQASGQFLKNRLWRAFMAGWNSFEALKDKDVSDKKIS